VIGFVLAGLAVAALGVSSSGGGATRPPVTDQAATGSPRSSAWCPLRALSGHSAGEAPAPVGLSAQGRPIRALVSRSPAPGPVILAVGSIHGSEPAGIEVVQAIDRTPPSRGRLVVVPNLNPDGLVRDTRTNARGVDLNRNFGSGWQPIGAPGDPEHSGPRPFSEPESRVARDLIRELRPDVTIWFHQQVEPPLVRASGPSVAAARAYARLAESPFDRLPWLPGSAPNWQNHRFGGTSSFVVELPWGDVSQGNAARHTAALLDLGAELREGGA
jgi:protein MpaA